MADQGNFDLTSRQREEIFKKVIRCELHRVIDLGRRYFAKTNEADLEQRMDVCLSPTVQPGKKGGPLSIFH